MKPAVFISYSTQDQAWVEQLYQHLAADVKLWQDARKLCGGDFLQDEISQGMAACDYLIVVVSVAAMGSDWVQQEMKMAMALQQQRGNDRFKIMPLLLENVSVTMSKLLFEGKELKCITTADFDDCIHQLKTALQLPYRQPKPDIAITAEPRQELLLKLRNAQCLNQADVTRLSAEVELSFQGIRSKIFTFISPLGPDQHDEIKWYIESYYRWPTGVFKQRAKQLEQDLKLWGKSLFDAVFSDSSANTILVNWQQAQQSKQFSIEVDDNGDEKTHQASAGLLGLPWEIMHDGVGYLFQGKNNAAVRRKLAKYQQVESQMAQLPIRVLLLSPRPEVDEQGNEVGYFNHRASALPLIQAVENLGEQLVKLDIVNPPTFAALQDALAIADKAGLPYHIVHFDGHGVYDPTVGLGALCFEHAKDQNSLGKRRLQLLHAKELAAELRGYGVPLIYLDACQTAKAKDDPNASVASQLLAQGIGAVVAMSHSVLVVTASRFVEAFYQHLAEGNRIGDAMVAGQKALYLNPYRMKVMGAGSLELQDWFVPVLYQDDDVQLFSKSKLNLKRHSAPYLQKIGELPAPPAHGFVGRSRLLLQLERLLFLPKQSQQHHYAVLKGSGGLGKTAIAVELARWLVRSGRFGKVAFVSVESQNVQDIKGVLHIIGQQLLGDFNVNDKNAMQQLERALCDQATLLLIDNMESVLPDQQGNNPAGVADVTELLTLCENLLKPSHETRLLFTSRETLPKPFNRPKCTVDIPRLADEEAIELVEKVMAEHGYELAQNDDATTAAEVTELVQSVHCHPRALVLLARELANGVSQTSANLKQLMAKLDRENPNDRENSLYASVELSLRRLTADSRAKVNHLAVFHGGGHIFVLSQVMEVDQETAIAIGQNLVDVGMAEWMAYGYLRLDPALPDYLKLGQSATDLKQWQSRWFDAMLQLVDFLYDQKFEDATLAAQLTLLELANIWALLSQLELQLDAAPQSAESVSDSAGSIEQLVADLGRAQALDKAVALREKATALLPEWGSARFNSERLLINRLVQQGLLAEALAKAQALLAKAQELGDKAYEGADHDLAMAHFLLGRILSQAGQASQVLGLLQQAEQLFTALAERGEYMASACLIEQGDCLTDLGRLNEAVHCYHERIKRGEKLNDARGVAVGKSQLAAVYTRQGKTQQALAEYEAAKVIFSQQNEPLSVATICHQIGWVYQQQGDAINAEAAYQQALDMRTRHNDLAGQAQSLTMLGYLYHYDLKRPEQAVIFYRQAVEIFVSLNDVKSEGVARNNLADSLLSLKRYDEARQQITRAIECKSQFGHAATPWTSFAILRQIELAANNPNGAKTAWSQAKAAYLAYRQQGGYAQQGSGKLADAVFEFIKQDNSAEAIALLEQQAQIKENPDWLKTTATRMLAVVNGQRDSGLADDIELYYHAVAEIQFLIERLDVLQ